MKAFDFDHPDFKKCSAERQKFLRENQNRPVTIEKFVEQVASWPKKKRHNSLTRSPSAARQQYRRLVEVFGFFPGGQGEN